MTRRFPSRTIALALALALCAAGVMAFCGVGRWLVREDPLGPADTIMVLSGGVPAWAEEAARIFRQGYAHEVWVSKPESPSGELAEMGIQYLGEDDYNREILIHEGVPEADVHVLPDVIVDTEQEVEEIAKQMHGEGKTSVIIVTSPEHTRRVKVLSRKLAGENLRAIVRGAPQDRFDANHWWRDTRDVFSVVREILGLLNAWAGLPVQPRSP
jgi:uncharacterized SAM-binding protein YcdF (DUF218 family)